MEMEQPSQKQQSCDTAHSDRIALRDIEFQGCNFRTQLNKCLRTRSFERCDFMLLANSQLAIAEMKRTN
jgi:hypothetical protein